MRPLSSAFASALVVIGLVSACAGARAQTYDPSYPVCMHVYGDMEGDRMDCIFTSLAQCAASATGRAAMCLINPYYAQGRKVPLAPSERRRVR